MKVNRFIALAAIALMVVGAMGAIASRSFALGANTPVAQASATTEACTHDWADATNVPGGMNTDQADPTDVPGAMNTDQAEATEVPGAPETNHFDGNCGDQNGPDGHQEGTDAAGTDSSEAHGEKDGHEAAPTGTPAITEDQAKQAAIAAHPGTVLKIELEEDNGKLIYSVQFDGDVEVKVDAMTGAILPAETGHD